ncbi:MULTISPECIES: FAD-binding domain-containing protein [Pseudomonadota]|jgi:deoxyribodipyrimidine photo-lyase|uniref:FAD-binding domain-containing protein n=3 Tax=Pseudomonadota TaxID=1224 RepID=UPI00076A46DB|nr:MULTISPECIES: FAD-binding domain-containing protein [Pseudomonadota]|tara:strand:+ start:509 stop:1705 length:1197 start_codon:yes stop_codon:yes gene_type:complete
MSGMFEPTRAAGLARMNAFVPHAGRAYAEGRNSDLGPGRPSAVSQLSPWLRYRLLNEQEVCAAVLERHSLAAAEKYVQEVLWRTYWKGWLEMRPGIWERFLVERDEQHERLRNVRALEQAEAGRTGIEGFDDWARELVETGYLHNHARMWFASIWIFTLRLPWTLGADFFLRHLIDADAASNTLSWRWVAGLQTAGKTYLATADNIARYTGGRFAPKGLAEIAEPLTEAPVPAAAPLPAAGSARGAPALLLITSEDMHPDDAVLREVDICGTCIAADPALLWGEKARGFVADAAHDMAASLGETGRAPVKRIDALNAEAIVQASREAGVNRVVTPYAPVGPVATRLTEIAKALAGEGIELVQVRRAWDDTFWPHARKGFFPFKQHMGRLLEDMGLTRT